MNKNIIIGNLTKDAEVNKIGNDMSVCNFTVAVNRRKQKGKEQEVDYFNVVTWREQADYCGQYLKKGNKVGVVGRCEVRTYEDKEGVKHTIVDVQAENVEKLSFDKATGEQKQVAMTQVDNQDLPF